MAQPIRFQLHIACENLVNRIAIGQPKPICMVFIKEDNNVKKLGETEVGNGLSPVFSRTIPFEYKFGKKQDIIVIVKNTIWHIVKRSETKMTFGQYQIPFDVILQEGRRGVKVKLKAKPTKDQKKQGIEYLDGGRCFITAYSDNPSQGRFGMDARVSGLPKPLLSSTSSFLEFTVPTERNRLLYRSEVQKGSDVNFIHFDITEGRLPDFETDVSCICYEYKEDARIKMGAREVKMTYNPLGQTKFRPIDLFEPARATLKLGPKALLSLRNIHHVPATFSNYVDYVQAGLKVKFTLALDFSESSYADHANEDDIPYFNAIRAFGGIMSNYDDDYKVPCFGYDEEGVFSLGENDEENLDDLLSIYNEKVKSQEWKSDGGVFLSPIVEQITDVAEKAFGETKDASEYNILVILSSGGLDDIDNLVHQITNKSQTVPLSIILVGIGNNNFYAFQGLHDRLNRKNNVRPLLTYVNTRDIPLPNYEALTTDVESEFQDEFASESEDDEPNMAQLLKYRLQYQKLAEVVMAQIPNQVETFYRVRNISPMRRRMALGRSDTFLKDFR